ncbi:MAG TPA: hypothetical protein ENI45_03805 [Thermoplasmatales archaeon]|nr:hypothetical protein [Thermoplasmatales archaeon]
MKKLCLTALFGVCILLLTPVASAAVSQIVIDETNDVKDINNETINAPNIDIKKITYYQSEGSVTITLQVSGKIDDESIYIIVLDTDAGEYGIEYTKNPLYADYLSGGMVTFGDEEITSEFSIPSSDTLRVAFDLKNVDEEYQGLAANTMMIDITEETMGYDEVYSETSTDTNQTDTSDTNTTDTTNGDETNGEDTTQTDEGNGFLGLPGFELLLFLIAAAAVMLLFRRLR